MSFPTSLLASESARTLAGGRGHVQGNWWLSALPERSVWESSRQPETFSKGASSGNPFPEQLASLGLRACQGSGTGVGVSGGCPCLPPLPQHSYNSRFHHAHKQLPKQ